MKKGNKLKGHNPAENPLLIIIILVCAAFFFFRFSTAGIIVAAISALFFLLPFYLILGYFGFAVEERLVFGYFLGLGLFSAIAYYVGFLVGSLRLAAIITFIMLTALGFYLNRRTKLKCS